MFRQLVVFLLFVVLAGPVVGSDGAIAVDGQHNIYVLDKSGVIQSYDSSGKYLGQFSVRTDKKGESVGIAGMAVSRTSEVFVCHYNGDLIVYDAVGKVLRRWTMQARSDGYDLRPRDIALDADDNVYVLGEERSAVIRKYNDLGRFLTSWDVWDRCGLAEISDSGIIYVIGLSSIRRLDVSGKTLGQFALASMGESAGVYPSGIAAAGSEWLFALSNLHSVLKLTSSGKHVTEWDLDKLPMAGREPPWRYVSIAADGDQFLYVAAVSGVPPGHRAILKLDMDGKLVKTWTLRPVSTATKKSSGKKAERGPVYLAPVKDDDRVFKRVQAALQSAKIGCFVVYGHGIGGVYVPKRDYKRALSALKADARKRRYFVGL